VRYTLRVEGVGTLLSLDRPLWTDNLLAKLRRVAYGGTVGPGSLMGPRGVGTSLLDGEPASRRYRFHPLIRLHARGQANDKSQQPNGKP